MKGRILVLNVEVSGMNKYLFSQLRKRGWQLKIFNVPFPKRYRYLSLALSFHFDIRRWKKRFDERLSKFYKNPRVFKIRTKFSQAVLKKEKKVDLIFQIGGLFAPYFDHNFSNQYVIMLSYTMALSKKYPPWLPPQEYIEEWISLEEALYKKASLIFTTNENARRSMINDYGIDEEKVVNVGYGLNREHLPQIDKFYDGKTILFIGMDFERKGGYVLLDAFRKVKKEIPSARLIIVGPNKEIYRINEPGVEFLGCIRDREIIDGLYKKASIFVMPSLCEPFGLVFLEAMAYKLACIGTTIDAMPEIIEDGKTGFLVSPNNAEELASKMMSLLKNKELMKKMGELGYLRVKEKFLWDRVGEKIDFYLDKLKSNV